MDQQSSSNEKDQLSSPVYSSTRRSSCQYTDRRDSITSSSRTFAPVTFFHESNTINDLVLQNHSMGAQRRARALATAPRRRRYDDDKDEEDIDQNKSRVGFKETSALPISTPTESQRHYSLPQTQLDISRLPTFRVDPPSQNKCEQIDHTYNCNPRRNHYASVSLPNKTEDWRN